LTIIGFALTVGGLFYASWDRIREELALRAFESDDDAERERAARKLGELRSRRAVPLLIAAVAEERLASPVAIDALASIGDAASADLTEALTDSRRSLRQFATEALLRIAPEELEPYAEHLHGLFDRSKEQQSVWAIGRCSSPPAAAIAALEGMVNDPQFAYTWMAAAALGQIGPPARRALPTIEAALERNSALEGHAAIALARIAVFDPEYAVPKLLVTLDRVSSRHAPSRVLEALATLGPGSRPALARIVREIDDREAIVALRRMRPEWSAVREHLPAILEAVPSRSIPHHASALAASYGEAAVADLIRICEDGNENARDNAVRALARIGGRARDALPLLRRVALRQPDAIPALGSLGPAASEAVPDLVRELGQHRHVEAALGAIGPAAVQPLIELLRTEDVGSRTHAAQILGAIGIAARAAIPDLIAALSADDGSVRHAAVRALGRMGPRADDAIAPLQSLLDDPDLAPAAAAAIVHIDEAGTTTPARLLPHLQRWSPWTFGPMTLLVAPSVSDGSHWIDRYPDFHPSVDEVLALFADDAGFWTAVQILNKRPDLLESRRVVDALTSRVEESLRPGLHISGIQPPQRLPSWLIRRIAPVRDAAVRLLVKRHEAERESRTARNGRRGFLGADSARELCEYDHPEAVIAPVLEEAAASGALDVAIPSARWLWRHGRLSDDALIDTLVAGLNAPVSHTGMSTGAQYWPSLRHSAAMALGELGAAASPAVDELRSALHDFETDFRARCAVALWQIEGDEWFDIAVRALEDSLHERGFTWGVALQSPNAKDISWALEALGPRALRELLPRFEARDEQVRVGLLTSIARLGKAAAPARSAVVTRLADEDFRVRERALAALASIGMTPAEVPSLIALLDDDDPFVRDVVVDAFFTLSGETANVAVRELARRLDAAGDAPVDTVVAMLAALENLGPAATSAIDGVLPRLGSSSDRIRNASSRVLVAIGQPAVASLRAALRHDEARRRAMALDALSNLREVAEGAIPDARDCLDDVDVRVRIRAARAVASLSGSADAAAVAALISSLDSDDTGARLDACKALKDLGPSAREAIDALDRLARSAERELRLEALRTVAAVARDSHAPLPGAVAYLDAPDAAVGLAATRALGLVGVSDRATAAALCRALEHEDRNVRVASARALETADVARDDAIGCLLHALHTTEPGVRAVALRSIGRLGPEDEADIAAMAERLFDHDQSVARAAAEALLAIGERARPAIPTMVRLVREAPNQRGALPVIQQVLPAFGKDVVDRLLSDLEPVGELRHQAWVIDILGDIGPAAREALPKIRPFLKLQPFYGYRARDAIRKIERSEGDGSAHQQDRR